MSGYTTPSSEIEAKSHGRKNPLSQGQVPPWAFLPLGYRLSAVASAMSGQFPPPSASPPIPYTTHHLPPAAPTPGQYPPGPTQRLRVPTLGSSPPPGQGHLPPWGHTAQSAGLNSLPGNLGFFGPPHLSGLSAPGRGQSQPWQASPKPTTHPVGGNPLFSLQMLVTQEASSASGAVTSIRPTDDYQQETMDLSSHSGSTAIDDHQTIRKDNLRNGGIVSNGEIGSANDERKSPAKPPDSVSVIAHNPLRESQEQVVGTVLNCSSKSTEKVLESSLPVKLQPELPVAEKPALPVSGVTQGSKPLSLSSVEKSATIVEKISIPVVNPEKTSSPCIITSEKQDAPASEKIESPLPVTIVPDKPPSILPKVSSDWEGSNHTPDNVESILENMFQTQEEKSNTSALPLVVPQSVIVTNESRNALQIDSMGKSASSIEKPASPEKINEHKLAEILKVEEPDIEMMAEIKTEEPCDVNKKLKPKGQIEEIKDLSKEDLKNESKSSIENMSIELSSSGDEKSFSSVEKVGQSSVDSQQKSNLQISNSNVLFENKPNLQVKTSSPLRVESCETSKNAFIEVESELEKMFAGIVEPGSEVSSDGTKGSSLQSSTTQSNRKMSAQEKKRGRPKGVTGRRSSDGFFSVDNSSKKKKRPGDSDKKTKKNKLDSGRDSPVVKKGRGSYVKDASNDSGSNIGVKSRGPLVHIEGSKEIPTSVVIVNSGVRTSEEDESTEKTSKSSFRKHSTYHSEGRATKIVGAGLYNSTLSSRYDSQTPDATWICVFCKRGPHCVGGLGGDPAGDLYGPYVISKESDKPVTPRGVPSDKDIVEEQKRRGGGKQASLRATGGAEQFVQKLSRKHKRSVSMDSDTGLAGMVLVSGEKNDYEVWMHENCAVWAPGMYLIGSKLVGLQEAVWAAVRMSCSKCGEPGACISCITRGCPLLLHYGCAVLEGWHLDVDTYIAKCRNHIKGAGFFPS